MLGSPVRRFLPALLLMLAAGPGLWPAPSPAHSPAAWPGNRIAGAWETAPPPPEAFDAAIDRGVLYLLEKQKPRGSWGPSGKDIGPTALAVHALLHAGIRETDLIAVAKEFGIKQPAKVLERTRQALADWEQFAQGRGVPRREVAAIRAELDARGKELRA